MAAVDDVVAAIQTVIESMKGVDSEFAAAVTESETAVDKANEVGNPATIEAFTEIKNDLEASREQLNAFQAGLDTVLGKAEAIAENP
jgi:hypothetical protein